jgi:hypothetical protein
MKWLVGGVLVLAVNLPAAFVLTILTARFWDWFERASGIESYGHSGPAGWCFWLVYALCVGASGLVIWKLRKRNASAGTRS